jgi:hypothetical protein
LRALRVIMEQNGIPESQRWQAWGGDYPDLRIYDGRELDTELARLIRREATLRPVCWLRKYIIIYYIDRSPYSVTPTLLKLIEEPPDHFSLVLTTLNPQGIPPTVLSRSLIDQVNVLPDFEIRDWLQQLSLDSIDLRVQSCAGDFDIATGMDIGIVRDWRDTWGSLMGGGNLPANFTEVWISKLEDSQEPTQIACWITLLDIIVTQINTHKLWIDLAFLAVETRNKIQDGHSNKIYLATAIIKAYALAVTIHNRVFK